jgi:hypothetical protein
MSQERKNRYAIYPSALERFVKQVRRGMGSDSSRYTDRDILRHLVPGSLGTQPGEITWLVLSDEHCWRQDECVTLFPAAVELMESLSRSRFSMDTPAGFALPFDSFVLAMPEGFKVDGTVIPSVLVNWSTPESRAAATVAMGEYMGVTASFHDGFKGQRAVSVTYLDVDGTYARTALPQSDFPLLLSSRDFDAFRQTLSKCMANPEVRHRWAMSDAEARVQYHVLRLIAALGVYNQATHGQRLHRGYPSERGVKLIGHPPACGLAPYSMTSPAAGKRQDPKRLQKAYLRPWHFRQLRAARYYQNEYKDMEPGSRWSFVPETVVNQRASAYTQE